MVIAMENKTVAELREYAQEHGIDLKGLTRKADILEAIQSAEDGAEVVEAEVIEEEPQELSVGFQPGIINANFTALNAQVDAMLAKYEDWYPDPEKLDEVKDASRERKYLNSLAKQLDDKRKAVKREFTAPLEIFEQDVKGLCEKIKTVSGRLKEVEDAADQSRRDREEAELKEHYECFAGALLEVVPFEKILDPKWLNKSVNIQAAKQELEDKTLRIVQEWENLKALNLECLHEAEAYYFEHLDFGAAVAYAQKLAEDKRKIEELKAVVEPEQEERVVVERIPRPVVTETAPRPIPRPAPITTQSEAAPCIMVIEQATTEQMQQIGKFCGSIGVHGTFKRGTIKMEELRLEGGLVNTFEILHRSGVA